MRKRKTHEEFVKEVQEKYNGEYSILGKYINSYTKISVRHNSDKCNNYEWRTTPDNILQGKGCPKCGGSMKKTTEQFKEEIKEKYGNEYTILGKYINAKTKILVRHNSDKCNNYEYKVSPYHLLNGTGCPVCVNQKVILGINTIYDTDRWMCDLGVSEEDAKKYTHGSHKKITVKCPDCGREKRIVINSIYRHNSISCPCGDGKSYPEKFVINTLDQLGIDYEIEKIFEWNKDKRYDFYIPSLSCIIETHGIQHYNGNFRTVGGRNLEEEQANDNCKRKIAIQNDIKHYIELDCSKSNLDYIKNSVLNSELNKLFNLSNIDWLECGKFANKNIVKEVCDYWNNKREDESTTDLEDKFRLSRSAVIKYLKSGAKLGWCSYNNKEEMRKNSSKSGKLSGKKVEIFKDNISLGVFESYTELERQSERLFGVKLFHSGISLVCRGKQKNHKGYTFKYI